MRQITIDDMLACVKRELAMRKRVYHKRVGDGLMDPELARREIEVMSEVYNFILEQSGRREKPLL